MRSLEKTVSNFTEWDHTDVCSKSPREIGHFWKTYLVFQISEITFNLRETLSIVDVDIFPYIDDYDHQNGQKTIPWVLEPLTYY